VTCILNFHMVVAALVVAGLLLERTEATGAKASLLAWGSPATFFDLKRCVLYEFFQYLCNKVAGTQ